MNIKRIIILFSIVCIIGATSCRSCTSSYQTQLEGVRKVCPNCSFVKSEGLYYAVDTSKRPNVIYIVRFKEGGYYYTASDVDALIRVN